ncbi:hypothetical protein VYU27_008087 [Nannochloropsis oceanica]
MEASEAATGRRRGRVGNRIERANPGSLCVVRVAEERGYLVNQVWSAIENRDFLTLLGHYSRIGTKYIVFDCMQDLMTGRQRQLADGCMTCLAVPYVATAHTVIYQYVVRSACIGVLDRPW